MNQILNLLPPEFLSRMAKQLGKNYENYERALSEAPVRGIRVNTKKISTDEFLKRTNLPLKKLDYCSDGFILLSEDKLGFSPDHISGLIYMQEPSSMIPVCSANLLGVSRVLDLCAAPGGKTGQLASRLDGAVIYSNEVVSSRVGALYSNIERQGFENVIVLNEEPEKLSGFAGLFDCVLVDAPCSGEGMFRKNPDTISEWSEKNVTMCARRQRQILSVAKELVKEGGTLIYSTCTFSPEEDEEIVEFLLSEGEFVLVNPEKAILSVSLPAKGHEMARKFYPFSGAGEGQFVAVLKKVKGTSSRLNFKRGKSILPLKKDELKLFSDFAKANLKPEFCAVTDRLVKVGETVYLPPKGVSQEELYALDGLNFETIGVRLGRLKKDRFEPDHAMFMAYENQFLVSVELDEKDLQHYLRGEQLSVQESGNGYAVVKFNGFAVGGGKLSGMALKNLLPKALRIVR